jgi:hypothetical protein
MLQHIFLQVINLKGLSQAKSLTLIISLNQRFKLRYANIISSYKKAPRKALIFLNIGFYSIEWVQ